MTLPTPDAQSPKSLTSPSYQASTAHSIPARLTLPATPPLSPRPLSPAEMTSSNTVAHMQGTAPADFSHPWDLATGGFKTLTAKRELVPPQQRRGQVVADPAPARSYMFLLVILACIVAMLISGGIVLFMTLQP